MRKKYLKQFNVLQDALRLRKESLTPRELYTKLFNWGIQLEESKDVHIKALYLDYFRYFEKLKIDDYAFEPLWYDFNDLLEFDLLKSTPETLESAAVVARDILWEIVAFKTDRDCKVLPVDNLRILTDEQKQDVFFCCDVCFYTEDINGIRVEIDSIVYPILYPATMDQVMKFNIRPANI